MTILPTSPPENWTLKTIGELLGNAQNLALALAGGIAVIFVLIGAFWYLTAYGNEEKANKGKTTVTWALIGVVVIILAEVIITTFQNLLQ